MTLRPSYASSCCILGCWILAACPSEEGTGDDAHDDHGDHGSTSHGTADHGTADHGTADHGIETSADDPAVIYCSCVLANCHDPYHAKWGDDEMVAQAACLMEADALPKNGGDTEMGNFIECRQHFCELAAADADQCANALGDAVCI